MTNDGANTMVYDAENRSTSAVNGSNSGTYTYDGNGLRVKKVSLVNGITTTTVYAFSGSKVIAEYVNGAAPASPSTEYIYAGGTLLAKIDSSGTKYYHPDHLSNRLVSDSSGNTAAQIGHFPFGESWYNASNDKLIFTTYERDSESGNDYAMARTYVNRLGRFSSPDPMAGSAGNPQSLNRYSYVGNNPVSLVDPTGLLPECTVLKNFLDPAAYDVGGYSDGEDTYGYMFTAPPPNCGYGGAGSGGGGANCWVVIDGGEAPCILAGSGEANDNCPNNDCSIFKQPQTAANGYQYWIIPGVNGYEYYNALNGEEVENSDELGLPTESVDLSGRISQAIQMARDALKDPKCASLFGPKVYAAGYLDFLHIAQGDLGPPKNGLVDAATTSGVLTFKIGYSATTNKVFVQSAFSTYTANVTINSNPLAPFSAGFGGYFGRDDATNRAATMIHELGHAIAVMVGPSASQILDDQNNPKQSKKNTKLVMDNCFPKKKK
jgi:RHS repeat-associated protein